MQRILVVMLLLFPTLALAQTPEAIMETVISGGDPHTVGQEFDVLVRVRDNNSGKRPIAAAFRVRYATGSVDFLSVSEQDLGSTYMGPLEFDASGPFRDVATLSDYGNFNPNPDCATLHFRVLTNAYPSYSIRIEKDPTNDALVDDAFDSLVVEFDSSATTDIIVPGDSNIADFNNDEIVNGTDTLLLMGGFVEFDMQLDLSVDGRLDYQDVFLFALYWGQVYP